MTKKLFSPLAACILCALGLSGPQLYAHGSVHDQIHKLSHDIEHHPKQAELWLKRGRLYMEDEHWQEAKADFEHALALDAELLSAHYFLARVRRHLGDGDGALRSVEVFLNGLEPETRGGRFRGHSLRGEILMSLSRYGEAAEDFGRALELADTPRPMHYLSHADALVAAERTEAALSALDAGVARLGPIAPLENRALELLAALGRDEQAVDRLRRRIASQPSVAGLRVELGEALLRLEKGSEATVAFNAALKILDDLPAGRSAVPAMRAMRRRAEEGLDAAAQRSPAPSSSSNKANLPRSQP